MSTTIKIYRHGETVWNKEGRLQGWLDTPLTADGIRQAQQVRWHPEIVYSSDLHRAQQTARYMFPQVQLVTDDRIREIYLGHWQGAYIKDLLQTSEYMCYMTTPAQFIPSTQESFQQVTERMLAFLQSLAHNPHRKIAIVSHGVSIACLSAYIQKRPAAELWQQFLTGGQCLTLHTNDFKIFTLV